MRATWCALPAVVALLAVLNRAAADTETLQCVESAELIAAGIFWTCQNFGSLQARQNTTYLLTVDAKSAMYQQYDINMTLTSLTGDADLIVVTPGATQNLASAHNVGQDIVFVYRTELAAGQYEVTVLGYALETEYELTVELAERARTLRPEETLALGRIMVDCCATDPTACTDLKAQFPQLSSGDPDVNPDYCYMHGNVCSRDGRLLELGAFASGDLACEFPPLDLMHAFRNLERLDLSDNRITGNITAVAATLGALPSLEYLDLGQNQITGPLDSACDLAATRKLEELGLIANQLTGSIPACITQLPELVEVHLDYNQLTGSLPAFATINSPLVFLTAAYQLGFMSGLSGRLPESLGRLSRLAYLDLAGNMLTGALPASLPASMVDLRLSENALTGSIPSSYGLMQNVVSLELQNNGLTGVLPAELAALPAAKLLDVSGNVLSGELPLDWSQAKPLTLLMASGNALTGSLPPSLALLNSLVVLDLHSNGLSGSLGEFAFQVQANRADLHSSLRYLDLGNNSLSGDLSRAEGLKDLAVFSNTAPHALTKSAAQALAANTTGSAIRARALMQPRVLDLSANSFTGDLPDWLVQALADCTENVTLILDGDPLTCPQHGFPLSGTPPPGRLDGLFCYKAGNSADVTDATPMADIASLTYVERHPLSGGAIFGIIVAVLVGVCGLAGLAFLAYTRRHRLFPGGSGGGTSFERFDKGEGLDGGAQMAGGNNGGGRATNIFASTGGPKFGGGGRMVYPDMHEVEMGDPVREQPGAKNFSVNLKGGRKLELP